MSVIAQFSCSYHVNGVWCIHNLNGNGNDLKRFYFSKCCKIGVTEIK